MRKKTVNKDLKTKQLQNKVKELEKKYLRALADYQNYFKRTEEEKVKIKHMVNKELILGFLPFLDDLYNAEIFIKDEGLKMIKNKLVKRLNDMGVKEIKVLEKKYDPNVAEAIEVVDGKKDNIVIAVLQKGYMYNNCLLRSAKVKVERSE